MIIPCYRSARYLERTVDELFDTLEVRPGTGLHLILVNDCSPDDTFAVIRRIAEAHPGCVTGVDLSENAGQAQAKMAGLACAGPGPVIFMDDDGQHDPRGIPRLLAAVSRGYDIVYAQFPETRESFFRRAGSRAVGFMLLLLTKKPPGLRVTSFFAISGAAREELRTYRSRHPFIGGWLFLRGYRAIGVRVSHRARGDGRSGYTLKKLARRAAELVVLYRIRLRPEEADPWKVREVIRGAGGDGHALT